MATTTPILHIGPADRGRRVTLDEFIHADFQEGWLYELARGVIVVTQVPGMPHGWTVYNLSRLFGRYETHHPDVIHYRAGGAECRIRLPGMQSDRHPDQAIYLSPPPPMEQPWMHWIPDVVVEVVSRGGKRRDYVEKREEYLRAGVREYGILEPKTQRMTVLRRAGDVWEEQEVAADGVYRTHLLPGLEARPVALFAPGRTA